jgi:subtilisin
MKLFATLHQFSRKHTMQELTSSIGPDIPMTVIDSIGETKPKLIECSPDDLPALRASHPSMRILPVLYYQPAMKPRAAIRQAVGMAATATGAVAATSIVVQVVHGATNTPVAGVTVVGFTNFATKAGGEGVTNATGHVSLALGGATHVERLYTYPPTDPGTGLWPGLQENVTLHANDVIHLLPVDLSYRDCVRYFYGAADLATGTGVTVGIVDAGVALNHADLHVAGGRNCVTGEKAADFGDNGTEGHGTHVAGIVAARGMPPHGIRGIAPGVSLRSYRVFPQGKSGASNYDIAKAIDAGISEGCTLLNLSLGGPQGGGSDPHLADAIAAAHNAGVLVFVANGNDSREQVTFPASATFSQAVSAVGRKGTFPADTEPVGDVLAPFGSDAENFIAEFSNIGPETDFTGPGVGVISTLPGGYGIMSGTSMATPAEVGAAARVLAAQPAILAMPADANRTVAMLAALAAKTKSLGFTPTYEGKGMIV